MRPMPTWTPSAPGASHCPHRPGPSNALFPLGGAIAAGPPEYPVPYRDASWAVHPFAIWEDAADDERCIQWVRDVRADVAPWSTGAVYLNFIGDEGAERIVAGWAPGTRRRLAEREAAATTRTTSSGSTTTSGRPEHRHQACLNAVSVRSPP